MIERVDLGEIEYEDAMARMDGWVAERRDGAAGDRLFLLSHPPVVSYGSRTPPADLPADIGVPTIATDRGGYATYHGPGQLVGYLVANVRGLSDAHRAFVATVARPFPTRAFKLWPTCAIAHPVYTREAAEHAGVSDLIGPGIKPRHGGV